MQFFLKHIHERDLLKRWQEVADLLPEFIKVNIGYIELIWSYTLNNLNKIKENDKIEIERMLKSHLNPELGEKLMNSLTHSWEQQDIEKGRKKEKIIIAKKMLSIKEPINKITNFTGLKKEEIEKLK